MWHPVQQNTDDPCPCCGKTWMELRAGKVTGSSIGKVMANFGKAFGDPAKDIAIEIADFELGGTPSENHYTNAHMERGHEEEPIARMAYQEETWVDVSNGGFHDNGKTGCSLDGFAYTNGAIEIKCVIKKVHFACLKRGSYDPKYKWQLIHNLKESGLEWIDFVSYCSAFTPDKRLFISRLWADSLKEEFRMIDERLAQFFELVEETKEIIRKAA